MPPLRFEAPLADHLGPPEDARQAVDQLVFRHDTNRLFSRVKVNEDRRVIVAEATSVRPKSQEAEIALNVVARVGEDLRLAFRTVEE